jgi:DNA recombination protein RmuC
MEYSLIAIFSFILGLLLYHFLFNKSEPVNFDGLSKDIQHLLDIQRKDWEKGQIDLKGVVNPLSENLKILDKQIREIETKREGAYKSLEKELEQLGLAHDLESALRSSSTRGQWGEMKLENIAKIAGLQKNIDYTTQETIHRDGSDIRPDMIVNLPNRGCIAIDAKAPLKSYLNASESQDETIQKDELVKHSKSMRTFMRSLYQKEYWSQFENAPELVVMFVPLESALYSAFEHDKELFDDALKHKVLIVSAVSLIALLKSIHHGWMQVQLDENTQKIADAGRNLYERFSKFSSMFQDIGKKLNTTQTAFNKAASSMNARLIPSMKKLKDMGTGSEEIKTSELLDVFEESEDENQLI